MCYTELKLAEDPVRDVQSFLQIFLNGTTTDWKLNISLKTFFDGRYLDWYFGIKNETLDFFLGPYMELLKFFSTPTIFFVRTLNTFFLALHNLLYFWFADS